MKIRKRKRIRYLDDIKKWRIEMLAKFGGFSRRYIASQVFGAAFNAVTPGEIASVSGFLSRQKIRLSTWRNGFSIAAQSYAKDVSKPKKRKRYRFAAQKRKKVA